VVVVVGGSVVVVVVVVVVRLWPLASSARCELDAPHPAATSEAAITTAAIEARLN
jgi:hypothetical protein